MKQMNLFREKIEREFGGSLIKGSRKIRRPLAFKGCNHLVLKATASHLLLRNQNSVQGIVYRYAKRFGVKIYSLAIQADHIHLKFRVGSRQQYRAWIRTVTAQLIRAVPKLKWRLRPWSRIVKWGKDSLGLKCYFARNTGEAEIIQQAHLCVANLLKRYGLAQYAETG